MSDPKFAVGEKVLVVAENWSDQGVVLHSRFIGDGAVGVTSDAQLQEMDSGWYYNLDLSPDGIIHEKYLKKLDDGDEDEEIDWMKKLNLKTKEEEVA